MAATADERPVAPVLQHVFSLHILIGTPVDQGVVEGVQRRFAPVIGGTVDGPRLQGQLLAGGGDWQTILPGGRTELDARHYLQATDGTVIAIHNQGVRLADANAPYFRTTARFSAAPGPHAWLNERLFVGRGRRMADHVAIDIYEIG